CGSDARRTLRPYDRNIIWPRAVGAYRRQGYAPSIAARAGCTRVQRRDRFPFATTGSAARAFWCARSDCALARLSLDIPSAVSNGVGDANVNNSEVWLDWLP